MSIRATKEIAKRREAEALRMRLEGISQEEIAQYLGVSQPAVSQMIDRVLKRSTSEMTQYAVEQRIAMYFQLEEIFVEAMKAWKRSTSQVHITSSNRKKGGQRLIVEQGDGESRFLDVMLKVLSLQQNLLGLSMEMSIDKTIKSVSMLKVTSTSQLKSKNK